MANQSIAFIKGILLSVLMGGLASCETIESFTSSLNTASEGTATSSPEASVASNGAATEVVGQDVTCETPNYLGEITWQNEEARITFGRKPDETNLNEATPVSTLSNSDGSTTYGYQGEFTLYMRAYPDGNCLLQALSSEGTVTVEEFGRTSFANQVSNQTPNPSIAQLSNLPADAANAAELPQPEESASIAAAPNPANVPASVPANVQPEFPQAGVTMSCPGNIKNSVDFTAYFAGEAGFNRVVFRPRDSKIAVVSNLSYHGKNQQGQDTWQGKANEVANIMLVHRSATPPQPGDQVAVDYDGLLGEAICQ